MCLGGCKVAEPPASPPLPWRFRHVPVGSFPVNLHRFPGGPKEGSRRLLARSASALRHSNTAAFWGRADMLAVVSTRRK
jgi:hypothetical protein